MLYKLPFSHLTLCLLKFVLIDTIYVIKKVVESLAEFLKYTGIWRKNTKSYLVDNIWIYFLTHDHVIILLYFMNAPGLLLLLF